MKFVFITSTLTVCQLHVSLVNGDRLSEARKNIRCQFLELEDVHGLAPNGKFHEMTSHIESMCNYAPKCQNLDLLVKTEELMCEIVHGGVTENDWQEVLTRVKKLINRYQALDYPNSTIDDTISNSNCSIANVGELSSVVEPAFVDSHADVSLEIITMEVPDSNGNSYENSTQDTIKPLSAEVSSSPNRLKRAEESSSESSSKSAKESCRHLSLEESSIKTWIENLKDPKQIDLRCEISKHLAPFRRTFRYLMKIGSMAASGKCQDTDLIQKVSSVLDTICSHENIKRYSENSIDTVQCSDNDKTKWKEIAGELKSLNRKFFPSRTSSSRMDASSSAASASPRRTTQSAGDPSRPYDSISSALPSTGEQETPDTVLDEDHKVEESEIPQVSSSGIAPPTPRQRERKRDRSRKGRKKKKKSKGKTSSSRDSKIKLPSLPWDDYLRMKNLWEEIDPSKMQNAELIRTTNMIGEVLEQFSEDIYRDEACFEAWKAMKDDINKLIQYVREDKQHKKKDDQALENIDRKEREIENQIRKFYGLKMELMNRKSRIIMEDVRRIKGMRRNSDTNPTSQLAGIGTDLKNKIVPLDARINDCVIQLKQLEEEIQSLRELERELSSHYKL